MRDPSQTGVGSDPGHQVARPQTPPTATPPRQPAPPAHPYYQPPAYQPRQRPQLASPGAATTLEEWQRRGSGTGSAEAREEELMRSLLRPQPGEEGPHPGGPTFEGYPVGGAGAPSPGYYQPASAIAPEGPLPPYRTERSLPRKRSQWPVVKGVAVIVAAAVVLSALQASGAMEGFREFLERDIGKGLPVYRSYPLSSEFELNRVMVTETYGGSVEYTVDVSIPMTISGQQEIQALSTNPAPTSTSSTHWTWTGTLTGGSDIQVVIGYRARATFKEWKIKPEASGTVSDVPAAYSAYLGECWKFQPRDPAVTQLAQRLAGGASNVLEKVSRIYEYINSHIKYMSNSPEEPKDPARTLSDGNGDCDDQSYLMGSLLRAQGVPAWMELGLLYDSSKRAWGGHAWLRVYIPLRSGGGEVVNIDPANDQFLFRDSYRLTDYIDDGDPANLQAYYVSWRYTYTGPPPSRRDRYDPIRFKPSDETVIKESSGPGPGAQAVGELWRAPGLEGGATILAAATATLLALRWRRPPRSMRRS